MNWHESLGELALGAGAGDSIKPLAARGPVKLLHRLLNATLLPRGMGNEAELMPTKWDKPMGEMVDMGLSPQS